MEKERLTAFSDGVIAIIITIMALEMKAPQGEDWAALRAIGPHFISYVLSFIYIGIYWNNHHHLLHTVRRVNGAMLWANTHLLFWLSLIPLATEWAGHNHNAAVPAAIYGFLLLMSSIAYYILQRFILRAHGEGSLLQKALGRDVKGKISPALYITGILLALVSPWLAYAVYAGVALMWLIPDRRIEQAITPLS